MQIALLLLIGMTAGVLSGIFGIGGGILIVPALTLLFGMNQQAATGTSLIALLLPVGILGAVEYFRSGKIGIENIGFGLTIALGLFIGALFGAKIGIGLSNDILRKSFAVFLVFIAIRLWLK